MNHFLRYQTVDASPESDRSWDLQKLLTDPGEDDDPLLKQLNNELARLRRKGETTVRSLGTLVTPEARLKAIARGTVAPASKDELVRAINSALVRTGQEGGVRSLQDLAQLEKRNPQANAIVADLNHSLARLQEQPTLPSELRSLKHWTQLLPPKDYLVAAAHGRLDPRAQGRLALTQAKVDITLAQSWNTAAGKHRLNNVFGNTGQTSEERALWSSLRTLKELENKPVINGLTLQDIYGAQGSGFVVEDWSDPKVKKAIAAYSVAAQEYRRLAANTYKKPPDDVRAQRMVVVENLLQTKALDLESSAWMKQALFLGIGLAQDVALGTSTVLGSNGGAVAGSSVAPGVGTVGGYVAGGLSAGLAAAVASRVLTTAVLKALDSPHSTEELLGSFQDDVVQVVASLTGQGISEVASKVVTDPKLQALVNAVVDCATELALQTDQYVAMHEKGRSWKDIAKKVRNDATRAVATNGAIQASVKALTLPSAGQDSRTASTLVRSNPASENRIQHKPTGPTVNVKGEPLPDTPNDGIPVSNVQRIRIVPPEIDERDFEEIHRKRLQPERIASLDREGFARSPELDNFSEKIIQDAVAGLRGGTLDSRKLFELMCQKRQILAYGADGQVPEAVGRRGRFGVERRFEAATGIAGPYAAIYQERAENLFPKRVENIGIDPERHSFTTEINDETVELTSITKDFLGRFRWVHTPSPNSRKVMKYVHTLADDLLKSDLPLERNVEKLAEIHWLFAHAMPTERGSALIGDWYIRALAQAKNIDLGSWKPNVGPDLEALTKLKKDFISGYKELLTRRPSIRRLPRHE